MKAHDHGAHGTCNCTSAVECHGHHTNNVDTAKGVGTGTHEHHHHEGESCSPEDSEEGELPSDSKFKYKFKITGIDCGNCANQIETKLNQEDFIENAQINFSSQLIFVNPKHKITREDLLEEVNTLVAKMEPGVMVVDSKTEVKESSRQLIIELLVAIVLFAIGYYFEDKVSFPSIYLFIVPYFVAGYRVLYKSVRNILGGSVFDENFLMTIATIGAFVVGAYEEAVAVMMFYSLGEIFQSYAVNKSRKSISDLMDIKSDYANLIQDDEEIRVEPSKLKVGNLIAVKAGEKVPVDGIIQSGNTSLDVSALSGEAALKDVGAGDHILAGSINTNGLIKVEVENAFEDSTVAKILELVENASSKKSPIENFITKFAKVYTPIVVALAVAVVIIPTLIFGFDEFNIWLYRGCTFLVISCPCALVVSVPLGVFAGIGSASRAGVLVKGGNYLELLNDVNTIIFDKTGTITKGNFSVNKVVGKDQLLEIAAYGESYSTHPIAQSIVKEYNQKIDFKRMDNYEELAGYGIKVLLDDKLLIIGNDRLMDLEAIEYNQVEELGTIIHVAFNNEYYGYIVVGDELKESSKQAIEMLDSIGIKDTVMLTGDRKAIAENIASQVGVSKVYSQLLPQDKVSILEEYLDDKDRVVAFVGDGINDAPALVRSDIGISMGGIGSDVAIEASDIVLMNDDLLTIPKAIKIAKTTKKILVQNISFSLGVKFIVLILTLFGITNMWMGVFADVGVTLIAVVNSMRALTSYKKV